MPDPTSSPTGHGPTSPLGELRNSRPRPTYAVAVDPAWQTPDPYPPGNFKRLLTGGVLRWRALSWRAVEGAGGLVQYRHMQAGVFGDGLVCCFTVSQTRNATGARLYLEDYEMACDPDSQELADHASVACAAIRLLQGRKWLYPGEVVYELNSLVAPRHALGSMEWAGAMLTLLGQLSRPVRSYTPVFILKAEPLELIWRVSAQGLADAGPVELQSSRQAVLAQRRCDALQRLYARVLGAKPMGGRWMAGEVPAAKPAVAPPLQLAPGRLSYGLSSQAPG